MTQTLIIFLFLCLSPIWGKGQEVRFEFSEIYNSTIRIESIVDNNGIIDTIVSTGFFYDFNSRMLNDSIYVKTTTIVANRKVVEKASEGILFFSCIDLDIRKKDTTRYIWLVDSFSESWIYHPDSTVDLAILPVTYMNREFRKDGREILYYPLNSAAIPDKKNWQEQNQLEDILVIGYPQGFWDVKNNLPVCRKGITAIPRSIDYNGEEELLLDIPVFEGSLGSPVFSYENGTYLDQGNLVYRKRFKLIGITTENMDFLSLGEIDSGTFNSPSLSARMRTPLDLATAIKSFKLLDFEEYLNFD